MTDISLLETGSTGDDFPYHYEGEYAQVRRDTIVFPYQEIDYNTRDYYYQANLKVYFPDGSVYYHTSPRLLNTSRFRDDLSVNPVFVREDAGPTEIEIKAQLLVGGTSTSPDIHITPFIEGRDPHIAWETYGHNNWDEYFSIETTPFVLRSGQNSATSQMIITPHPNDERVENFLVSIATPNFEGRAYILFIDDDNPTSEIELTVSDPIISTDGRATDVIVTGTINGALLDETISFWLELMPPTTVTRDIDFGVRLARLTIPAGQATGTATIRVTPRNRNSGKIWLGTTSHPTLSEASIYETIVVNEVPIELTKQPSQVIKNIEVLPGPVVREDAGPVDIDLKVILKEALPVDEVVRFEIMERCDEGVGAVSLSPTGCFNFNLEDTITRDTEYKAKIPPLTIPAGQTEGTATISLEVVDDNEDHNRRMIWLVASIGNSRHAAYILIVDDMDDEAWIELKTSPNEITEDSGPVAVTVTGLLFGKVLSEPLTLTLGSMVSPLGEKVAGKDVATRDLDYTIELSSLTIPAGQTTGTATVTITPTPNDGQDKDELIRIVPVGYGQAKLTASVGFGQFSDIKITEDGTERELTIFSLTDITLKDVADAPTAATPIGPATPSLVFDPPTSTSILGLVGQALSAVLPTTTSDPDGALTYRVFNLPNGLTFDPTTRTITGTPTLVGQTSIEYYALAEGASPAMLTYTINIQEKPVVPVELRGIAASLLSIREDASEAVTITIKITLRNSAKEDALITLAITDPAQGKTAKLNEDFAATMPPTVTIPTGKTQGKVEITVLTKDNTMADGTKSFAVLATSPSGHQALINIQIVDDESASPVTPTSEEPVTPDEGEDSQDSAEPFAFAGTVDDQAYTEGTEITALVLPAAMGGQDAIAYSCFDLPAGLAFDPATRTVSGTPTAATDGAVKVTYLAQDSAGIGITLTFSIMVNPALSFGAN